MKALQSGHEVLVCKHGRVVATCRCPNPNKTQVVVKCPDTCTDTDTIVNDVRMGLPTGQPVTAEQRLQADLADAHKLVNQLTGQLAIVERDLRSAREHWRQYRDRADKAERRLAEVTEERDAAMRNFERAMERMYRAEGALAVVERQNAELVHRQGVMLGLERQPAVAKPHAGMVADDCSWCKAHGYTPGQQLTAEGVPVEQPTGPT